MIDQNSSQLNTVSVVGIASDHGGHGLKTYLMTMLHEAGVEVIDFGDRELVPEDDYPNFVIPMARAVAAGQVDRGIAICGSGVGACVAANKVAGVRACLIQDTFSAHQGVEHDNLNFLCLGGQVVGKALAWEFVRGFLLARFLGKRRHLRRLRKVAELENSRDPYFITAKDLAKRTCCSSETNLPLQIYVIRHGETEWTFADRFAGVTDLPLTALGEDEVREWGHRFFKIPFTHVLISSRQRARRTCELVGLADFAEIDEGLSEWDYGEYEGMRAIDVQSQRPGWDLFHDGCPKGESPHQISDRADQLIARLRSLSGNVAVFSHGLFCSVLAARWIDLPVIFARHFPLDTASLGILKQDPHHPSVPIIELWNSTPHEATREITSAADPSSSMRQATMQSRGNEGAEIVDLHSSE